MQDHVTAKLLQVGAGSSFPGSSQAGSSQLLTLPAAQADLLQGGRGASCPVSGLRGDDARIKNKGNSP